MEQERLLNAIERLSENIEKMNVNTGKKKEHEYSIKYYFFRYIQEIFEASIGLIVVVLLTKKQFSIQDFIRIVCIIGGVTLILEEYNLEYSDNIRQGIYFTIGAVAFSG